jgi:ABC-2 type transport system permease protein
MFLLPVVFMAIFGIAFGQSDQNTTFNIGYVGDNINYSSQLIETLSEIDTTTDSDVSLFDITEYENFESAEEAVLSEDILLFIDLSDDFQVKVYGDQQNPAFSPISAVISDVVSNFNGVDTNFISTENILSEDAQGDTTFDILVPGLIIYGILILIPGIAQTFTEISERGYLFRFFTSQTKAIDIIAGFTIYYLAITILQVLLLFLSAQIMGFSANGSLLFAFVASIPAGLFSIGLGLIIGAFVDKTDAATNIGTIVSIILGFFSGSFIVGIENALRFNIGDLNLNITDLFPSKHATDALQVILRQNGSLGDVTQELIYVLVPATLLFVVGVWLYSTNKLRAK